MNERIKLLIEQATTRIDPSAHDGVCWDFDREKFARLIIEQCIQVAKQADTEHQLYAWYAIQKYYE